MKTTLALPSRISQGFLGRLTLKSTIKIQCHERCIWGQRASHSLWRRVVGRSWGRMKGRRPSWGSSLTLPLSAGWLIFQCLRLCTDPILIPSLLKLKLRNDSLSCSTSMLLTFRSAFPTLTFLPSLRFHDLRASWVAQKTEAKMELGDFLGVTPMKDKSGCVIYSPLCNKLPHSYCGSRIWARVN